MNKRKPERHKISLLVFRRNPLSWGESGVVLVQYTIPTIDQKTAADVALAHQYKKFLAYVAKTTPLDPHEYVKAGIFQHLKYRLLLASVENVPECREGPTVEIIDPSPAQVEFKPGLRVLYYTLTAKEVSRTISDHFERIGL